MSNCCLETNCLLCCINTNMILSYHDIETIQKMGFDYHFFVTEQEGWLQLRNHHGRCVFHTGKQCDIYPQRPEGCRLYPVVYDKSHARVILDSECPQRHKFPISKTKERHITTFVRLLEKEQKERLQKK